MSNPANVTITDDLIGSSTILPHADLQAIVDGLGYLYDALRDRLTALQLVDDRLSPVTEGTKGSAAADIERCIRLHALFSDLLERST